MDELGDLIDRLCCEAGKIMEDVSVVAVTVGPSVDRTAKIAEVGAAARDIGALAQAAAVLDSQGRV